MITFHWNPHNYTRRSKWTARVTEMYIETEEAVDKAAAAINIHNDRG